MDEEGDPKELAVDGPWPAEPDPRLSQFLAYWRSRFDAGGQPPRQRDINPADIPDLLSGLLILERQKTRQGSRYLYRLAGTSHYQANGLELTGRFVDEVYGAQLLRGAYPTYERILSTGRPHYWAKPNPLPNRETSDYERILMPLRAGDGSLSMMIGYWLWH